jgi:hypothetical protein
MDLFDPVDEDLLDQFHDSFEDGADIPRGDNQEDFVECGHVRCGYGVVVSATRARAVAFGPKRTSAAAALPTSGVFCGSEGSTGG